MESRSLGARTLKGFSRPVELFRVEAPEPRRVGDPPGTGPGRGGTTLALLAGLLGALVPGGAAAQAGGEGLPTLADLGAVYVSESGAFQLSLSGRADFEVYRPQESPPWMIPETDPFVAGRARLFADVFAGDRIYGLVELRADRGDEPRAGPVAVGLEQLFVRARPLTGRSLTVQAGRMVSPVGGYPRRHHTEADPFIRPPPTYDVRTMVSSSVVPPDAGSFGSWQDEPETFRPVGAPPIWGAPYPWGVLMSGRIGPVVAEMGVMNSAPSSEPEEWGLEGSFGRPPSWVGRASLRPTPELRIAASYSSGPYLRDDVEEALPVGQEPEDYVQRIGGVEVEAARGPVVVRGELFFDRWEVPNVSNEVDELSGYLEGTVRPLAGLSLSARYGWIRYGRLKGSTVGGQYGGAGGPAWDRDFSRLQVAAGYRILRNLGAKAEYSMNRTAGPDDPADDLAAVQLWWSY